ncbi:MAG: hypothetical protein GY781_01330 [Gammaproteobacteria bacterium]|nr:hypothetical protein [Gammaproteobacteria bacterium]
MLFLLISTYSSMLLAAENSTPTIDTGMNSNDPKLDSFNVNAQSTPPPDSAESPTESADLASAQSKLFPAVWCGNIDDELTRSTCWSAYRNGLEYYEFGLTHRKSVLQWQHLSTQIILIVVLILVAMGLYFAWVQFKLGIAPDTTSQLKISTDGIQVSSPVLGVIILTLSLGFFYLYLVYVYPIQEVI